MNMKRAILVLAVLLAVSAGAEEEMRRRMVEARGRILEDLQAQKIPADIGNVAILLNDMDVPTREDAAKKMLAHSDRKTVIAAMILAMKEDDNDRRPNAGTVLAQIGAEALEPLMAALKSKEATTRQRAAWTLSEMGDGAKPAIPALIEMLKSSEPLAVGDGAIALGKMGQDAKEALMPLIAALKCPDQEVRASVASAIKQLGPTADHIPLLLPALKDPYMKVRSTVTLTFGYMGEAGKPAIPEIIKGIKDENTWVRMHSCASLARFGPDAKDAVPQLREALSDEMGIVRGTAAMALAKIAPSADFVPDFIKLLQDSNERVRTLAEDAIFAIGKPAVDDLKAAASACSDAKLKLTLEELARKIKAQ
jgi:HEAT repeat protein